jgi:dTMP kinase
VPARFITFEGIDGAGKSTHIGAVAERMRAAGATVLCTREPRPAPPLAETLRELVLHQPMDPLTEALLVFGARRDHVKQVIEPALARGDTVLCDRFTDATFAYQGGGRGFDTAVLAQLEAWVQRTRAARPHDLVRPARGARRRAARRGARARPLRAPGRAVLRARAPGLRRARQRSAASHRAHRCIASPRCGVAPDCRRPGVAAVVGLDGTLALPWLAAPLRQALATQRAHALLVHGRRVSASSSLR